MPEDDHHPVGTRRSFAGSLKAKGRRRREALKDMAAGAVAPHPRRNGLLPQLELVWRATGDLVIPARNIRKKEAAHVREIAASISALGFCDPVLIDGQNGVLDGAVRVEAAKLAGLPRLPCIVATHLSPSERKLLRIALNRLQEKGDWGLDELKLEMEDLILEDMPLEISGFSTAEIDHILMDDELAAVEEGPLEPEPDAEPVAKLGDVFLLGEHRIICGDATDPAVIHTLMAGDEARLILTDEPYNVAISGHVTKGAHREFAMASGEMSEADFLRFNAAWLDASLRYLCDGGLFGTFIDWRGLPTVHAAAIAQGLTPINLIVWAKTNAGMGSLYRSQHELLPLFKKGKAPHINNVELGRNGRWRSNLWTYPGASSIGSDARRGLHEHPTVKPVAILEDALLDMTERGDIVLDPFLGSGSTLIAAEKTGRRCRGVELDPLYVDVILRRYEALTGQAALLESTGQAFAELPTRARLPTE